MASTAETAAARIAIILTAAGLAGGRVFRDRTEAFAAEESPSVVVEIVEDNADHFGGVQTSAPPFDSQDMEEVAFSVTYLTRSANWQTNLDALRVQAHALLVADADLNTALQGFRRTSANWDPASADVPFGTLIQRYTGKTVVPSNQL